MLGNAYRRYFLVFRQEDAGYGTTKPSGYMKIEIRGGSGRLDAFFSGLTGIKDECYKLYLVRAKDEGASPVEAGSLDPGVSEGHIRWDFSPASAGKSGFDIDGWDTAVLVAQDKKSGRVICPLAAYREGKTNWRKHLDFAAKTSARHTNEINGAGAGRHQEGIEKGEDGLYTGAADNKEDGRILCSARTDGDTEGLSNAESGVKSCVQTGMETGIHPCMESAMEFGTEPGMKSEMEPIKESGEYAGSSENGRDTDIAADDADVERAGDTERTADAERTGDTERTADAERAEDTERDGNTERAGDTERAEDTGRTGDMERAEDSGSSEDSGGDEEVKRAEATDDAGDAEEAEAADGTGNSETAKDSGTAQLAEGKYPEDEEKRGPELEKLERILNRDFQKANPFRRTRSDYDWWKVESPVHLNNALHFCGIKAPLLFNNDVMALHHRYGHLIAGIFRDVENACWFVVCGIPAAFMIDSSPFGNMCRWVRAGGQRPGYGSMGYWLVYIDPYTGNILKIN